MEQPIAFIGGGNMASALIGGLLRQGIPPAAIEVVEPWDEGRARLHRDFGITAQPAPGPALTRCGLVVWAVKPQTFHTAAQQARAHVQQALHLSVAAGIRSDSIAAWLGTERIVRCMPNTPALVGQGMTGVVARPGIGDADRAAIGRVLAPTGDVLWLQDEAQLDAVTAVSGSGPAYVFYLLEAMEAAGVAQGLSAEQAHRLAVGTLLGGAALARDASDPPAVLRQRVTSPGGTTHAAISHLESHGVRGHIETAIAAAARRAAELGDEFGRAA
jgi:pyrroline-5-carboxylate reductase